MLDIIRAFRKAIFHYESEADEVDESMPSYHEHCGKPGPNSLSYIPPAEARLFKSQSAPGSPLFDRPQHFHRSAKGSASFREPRHTRASFLLRESQIKKAEKYKTEKDPKIRRSKSFTSRITSKLYNRSKWDALN